MSNSPVPVPNSFAVGEALAYGWNGFKRYFGPLVVLMLIVIAITAVMFYLRPQDLLLSLVVSVVQWVVWLMIGLGLIRAALAIVDGRAPVLADLLSTEDLLPYFIASIVASIVVGFGLLLCIIPGLIAAYLLQFYGYAIVDDQTGSTRDRPDGMGALSTSYEITTKTVGTLLPLVLACALLNLVGALLCGFGLLVTAPVTAIAIAFAWRRLTGGRVARLAG